MSTTTQEQLFYDAVNAAEGVRQNAKAKAQSDYGFVQSKYAAFVTALVAADTTYMTSITTAASTGGIDPQLAVVGPLGCGRSAKVGGN